MNIFINALSARLGGGQTYLRNLLQHVPQGIGLRVFVLVQPSFQLNDLPSNVERLEKSFLENPFLRGIWEEVSLSRLLKKLNIDLFFSPGGLLPKSLPTKILTAVTFQNMLPFDHLQRKKYRYGYRWFRDFILERGLSSSMCRADLIIFISEFAEKFIKTKLKGLQGQSIVAAHGIHPSFRVDIESPLARPVWLPEGDYFLYVSYIDNYKAQLEVVREFMTYVQNGGSEKLVLVGAENKTYADLVRHEIHRHCLSDHIFLAGNMPHSELPAAYQNAKILIFASFTENCPNILLEMMASGRPSIVSNWGPMPEFGGDAVCYFDPSKLGDLSKNLSKIMLDKDLQDQLSTRSISQSTQYTWTSSGKATWKSMLNLIDLHLN